MYDLLKPSAFRNIQQTSIYEFVYDDCVIQITEGNVFLKISFLDLMFTWLWSSTFCGVRTADTCFLNSV
jgi:hypothetical protein